MKPRRLLPAALFAALLLPAAAADAKAPSCTRDGFSLQQAAGKVRIVTKTLRTNGVNETRREAVSACWTSTGKRFRIATERDFGDDLHSSTRVEIVDERYVGVVETGEGGVSIGVTAAVFDARKAKRLHSTSPKCDADTDDFVGPDDVVFLPKGGMAFTCDALWFFKDAAQKTATQLEPATARPRSLALSHGSDSFSDVLYWTLADGTTKSLTLL